MIWHRAPTGTDTTVQVQCEIPRRSLIGGVSISPTPIRTVSVEQYGLPTGADGLADLSSFLGHWVDAVQHNIVVMPGHRGCLDVTMVTTFSAHCGWRSTAFDVESFTCTVIELLAACWRAWPGSKVPRHVRDVG